MKRKRNDGTKEIESTAQKVKNYNKDKKHAMEGRKEQRLSGENGRKRA